MKNNDKKLKDIAAPSVAEANKRKARKTRIAISMFIMLLAVGVGGNWYWENSDISSKVSVINNVNEKILGEAKYVDATAKLPEKENEYFSKARIERQSSRDESIDKLQKIVNDTNESESSHKAAVEKIASLSDSISTENKIETLIKAKGVNNCLAIINEDGTRVDVIVDVKELNDDIVLQIKDIATKQLGCSFSDVTIIQSN